MAEPDRPRGSSGRKDKKQKGGKRPPGKGEHPPEFPSRRLFEKKPASDPTADGPPREPPKPGKWKKELAKGLKKLKAEREDEAPLKDDCGRDRTRVPMPRPYLDATSNFGPQITALNVGEAGEISFTVWNDGNVPAWSCYVEVYEGPGGYDHPISDYELRGRRIITLHPGERRDVVLPWVRDRVTGRVVGLVYDPVLDPRGFTVVEQFNRHITSVHFSNLD